MQKTLSKYEPTVYAFGRVKVDNRTKAAYVDGQPLARPLTDVEFKVIWYLAKASYIQPGRSFTPNDIWEEVWPNERNFPFTLQFKTAVGNKVSKNASEIRAKLDDANCLTERTHVITETVRDATPPESLFLTLHRIFICSIAATTTTVLFDTPTRAILAAFNATIAQSKDMGFTLGFLQGALGAMLWSLGVGLPLFTLWFLLDEYRPWRSRLTWLRGTLVAGCAGAGTGLGVSVLLLRGIYAPSRVDNGWLLHLNDPVMSAFTQTRVAYSEVWFGFLIGACVAFTLLWILSRPAWAELLLDHNKLTQLHEAWGLFRQLFRLGAGWATIFILPTMLLGAWLFAIWLPHPPPGFPKAIISLQRIIGEAVCIGVGGITFIIGTLVALYSMTKGVNVSGDDKCSLSKASS